MQFVRVNDRSLAERAIRAGVPGGPSGVAGRFWGLRVPGLAACDIYFPDETVDAADAFTGRVYGRAAPSALERGEWREIGDLDELHALVEDWRDNAVPRQQDAACAHGGFYEPGPAVLWEFFLEEIDEEESALDALTDALCEHGEQSPEFTAAQARYLRALGV